MIKAQEFSKLRRISTTSTTLAVSIKKSILEASGFMEDDKVYTAVEKDEKGNKRIIIERV
jgi:hypothetical protein